MAITKKVKNEIITEYKNIIRSLSVLEKNDKLYELMNVQKFTYETIMKKLGFERNDFIVYHNEVMEQYNFSVYCIYREINNIINEIAQKEVIFYYKINIVENVIDEYVYNDRRQCLLSDKLYLLKQEIERQNKIKEVLENKIKAM